MSDGPGLDPRGTSARVLRALRGRRALWRFLRALAGSVDAAGGSAWLVGGFVRDLVAGRPGKDVDVAVAGLSAEVLDAVLRALPREALGIRRIVRAGRRFPVHKIAVTWARDDVDVAPARPPGRGTVPRVPGRRGDGAAFGDASRRDFTINSLLFALRPRGSRLSGEVVDPFGGVRDLRRRRIRAVGDPRERFREDPLRLLRAVRFRRELPGSSIGAGTERAIRESAPLVLTVPGDRTIRELLLSLAADPAGTVRDLRRLGLLSLLLPEIGTDGGIAARMARRYDLLEHALGRPLPPRLLLVNFLLDVARGKGAPRGGRAAQNLRRTEAAARRLRVPGLRGVMTMIADLGRLEGGGTAPFPRVRAYEALTRESDPRPLLALHAASRLADGRRPENFRTLLARGAAIPVLPGGAEIVRLGIPPGPAVMAILTAVREAALEGTVRTPGAARELARRLAGAPSLPPAESGVPGRPGVTPPRRRGSRI